MFTSFIHPSKLSIASLSKEKKGTETVEEVVKCHVDNNAIIKPIYCIHFPVTTKPYCLNLLLPCCSRSLPLSLSLSLSLSPICFQGHVQDEERAIERLGGTEAIQHVRRDGILTPLNLRRIVSPYLDLFLLLQSLTNPVSSPFTTPFLGSAHTATLHLHTTDQPQGTAHPLVGTVQKGDKGSAQYILKLIKKRNKDGPKKHNYHIELVGNVEHTVHFKGLADFQFVPPQPLPYLLPPSPPSSLFLYPSSTVHPALSVPDSLTPSLYTRFDYGRDYYYQPSTWRRSKEEEEETENKTQLGKRKPRRWFFPYNHDQPLPEQQDTRNINKESYKLVIFIHVFPLPCDKLPIPIYVLFFFSVVPLS